MTVLSFPSLALSFVHCTHAHCGKNFSMFDGQREGRRKKGSRWVNVPFGSDGWMDERSTKERNMLADCKA